MRKRILCAMLALLLIVTLLPVVAGAASDPTITFVQQATAAGASEVKVDVKITNNPGFVSATIPVKWDASIMTLTNVTEVTDVVDSGWCSMSMTEYATNGTQGTYYLAWNNDTRTEADGGNFTNDGTLATLTFALVDETVNTNTQITSNLTADIANMMNYDMVDLRYSGLTAVAGMVNVTAADAGGEPSDATMTVANVKGKAGGTVDVTIKFESENGFGGIAFDVKYDKTILTLQNVTSDVKFTTTPISNCDGKCNFQFVDTQNNTNIANFATLTFAIAEGTLDGETAVTVVMEDGAQFYYDGQTEVDFDVTVVAGGVTIYSYIAGDATGDEKVNNRDAARILQYLASWSVEIQLEACDVTGDGRVNNRDAARILQYLAGWDVTFSE